MSPSEINLPVKSEGDIFAKGGSFSFRRTWVNYIPAVTLLDVAFFMDAWKPEGSLKVERLVKEELLLVAAPNQSKANFSIDDLKHETLLLTEAGCSYRNMFEESLKSLGIYSLHKIEFASIEAIKQCVIAGLGVALLPEIVTAGI